MPTSSAMKKSWHRRDFLKSHKNKHSARPLRDVGDGRLLFFDGFEVDKTKMDVSLGLIQPPTTHGREAIMRC